MTNEELYRPIAERLLSLSQAYKVVVECVYRRGGHNRVDGFTVHVSCFSLKQGDGSVEGWGFHSDHQATAMVEALDMAYQRAVEAAKAEGN